MVEQQASTRSEGLKSNGQVLTRLLATFLPFLPIFLSLVVATAVYAGTMTARVALVVPALRVFVEEIPPEEAEKLGLPKEVTVVHTITREVGQGDSALAKVYAVLDRMDRFFIDLFGVEGDPEKQARVGALATLGALFVLISLLAAVSNFTQEYLRALLVVRVLVSLRVRLLENLLQQPLGFYNEQKRGELIARMSSDVGAATVCLSTLAGPLLRQPFLLLAPIVVVLAIKWYFVFFIALFLTALGYSVRRQGRKVQRRARVRQRTIGKVTESMVQMFSGIRVVKAFGLESAKVDQYKRRNQEFTRDFMATEATKAWTRAGMELITHLMILLVVVVVLVVIGAGGTLPPDLLLIFFAFMMQMYRPCKLLTRAYTELVDNLAGTRRVFEFMDLRPALTDIPGAVPLNGIAGQVSFRNVAFSYSGNGRVLEDINLDVPAGEVLALVGHSGAGKSTLVNLVPRFYDPDEGSVCIDGTDVREVTRQSLLSNIGIVTQEPFLFNTSIRENIAYGRPGATQEEIEAAAGAAQIHEFVQGLPRGYETFVGERGANLSGGQCQRVTIARAILRDPRILILDEATSNLDTESEHAVQQALANLMRGRTTLVIAHRLSTIQHADRICVMQDGHICEIGTHDELMARESLYRHLYELQFGGA